LNVISEKEILVTEKSMLDAIVAAARRQIKALHFRVILFGSRAEGKAREGSDYDIAIEAPGGVPFGALSKMEGDLEALPTLAKVDLVDLATADQGISTMAKNKGRVLYEQ
jgi:predicted nucleotidyltransferase